MEQLAAQLSDKQIRRQAKASISERSAYRQVSSAEGLRRTERQNLIKTLINAPTVRNSPHCPSIRCKLLLGAFIILLPNPYLLLMESVY